MNKACSQYHNSNMSHATRKAEYLKMMQQKLAAFVKLLEERKVPMGEIDNDYFTICQNTRPCLDGNCPKECAKRVLVKVQHNVYESFART